MPKFNLLIFSMGFVGALAPEVLRIFRILTKRAFKFPPYYFLASAAFGVLGGLLAWTLPATTLGGALYIGICTPAIISEIGRRRGSESGSQYGAPSTKILEKSDFRDYLGS